MSIKYTEDELNFILNKNKKLKIASVIGKPLEKIKIEKEEAKKIIEKNTEKKEKVSILDEKKEVKVLQSDIKSVNKNNLEAKYSFDFSENHFSFVIFGARLLSVNQIFALLQYKKYEIFKYKKNWHKKIQQILIDANKNGNLPFFDDKVKITLFRQAPKLVDEDAMPTMYKFIIDAIKTNNDDENSVSLIKEDNPKIVHEISCYSEKGEYAIGFKVEKIQQLKKPVSLTDFLIQKI